MKLFDNSYCGLTEENIEIFINEKKLNFFLIIEVKKEEK